jgi:hypothetical protein
MLKRSLLVASFFVLLACSSSSSSDTTPDDGGAPTPEESASFDDGAAGSTSAHQALVAADSLFDFDPTLDPKATAEANTQAVATFATTNLQGCGSVTVAGTTVTVAFGPPPGCTLKTGIAISGTATATISSGNGTTKVALGFASLVVGGHAVDGTATLTTTDGSKFTAELAIRSGSTSISGTVTVQGSKGAFTVDGPLTVTGGDAGTSGTSVVFTSMHYTLGACYPDGGSMKVTKGLVTETITFDASTPTTGVVTVTTGRRSTTQTLPAYGSCPTSKGSDAGADARR